MHRINQINRLYQGTLKNWFVSLPKHDDHSNKIYQECLDVYQEVKESSLLHLRKILHSQLMRL